MNGWAVLKHHRVRPKPGGDPFIDRLKLVQTPWFGLYVHVIHQPDADPDPHDHPWVFWSVVLSGIYREVLFTDPADRTPVRWREHRPWRPHLMRRGHAHLVKECSRPCWTLCLVGRNHGDWRFWTAQGQVEWQRYLADQFRERL